MHRRVILRKPLDDPDALQGFVEHCLKGRVEFIVPCGPDGLRVETEIHAVLANIPRRPRSLLTGICDTIHDAERFLRRLDPDAPFQVVGL
ncbi:hypothetical protein HKCCE2091_07020 [Rhodobacterales bacterium HKCCE2091]|nr:hypothetical protein [Rhodobacterales bacterium HKCCE2091]